MNTKLIVENWRKFLTEVEQKPALYTGAVVEETSVNSLRDSIPPEIKESHKDWLYTQIGSHGHEQLNHHMTLVPAPAAKAKDQEKMNQFLNQKVQLEIIEFGLDETLGIAAWKVKSDVDSLVQSGVPHITAMLKDGSVKPFLASKIKSWQPVKSFKIDATIKEVFQK